MFKRFISILYLLFAPALLGAQTTVVKQSTPEPLYLYMQSTTTGNGTAGLTITPHYLVGTSAVEVTGAGMFVDGSNGNYSYVPSAAELATAGKMLYRFSASGAYDYSRELRVASIMEADVYARLGMPTGASLAADIAANGTSISGLPSAAQIATATWNNTVRGLTAAVMLPTTAPAGYGYTSLSSGDLTAIANSVLGATVDSGGGTTLTVKQALFLTYAAGQGAFGTAVRSVSAPWTITVPWLRLDGTTTAWSYVTTYTDSTFSKAASRAKIVGTLPQ